MCGEDGQFSINTASKICSAHFAPQDYTGCEGRILKSDAVPSKHRFSRTNNTVSVAQSEAATITKTPLTAATTTNYGSQIGTTTTMALTNFFISVIQEPTEILSDPLPLAVVPFANDKIALITTPTPLTTAAASNRGSQIKTTTTPETFIIKSVS